jgi:dipeptide transport system substrate-binding protein
VRRAIAAAIDREAIVADIFKGAADPTGAVLSPLMPGGGQRSLAAFDAATAKQAVAAADAAGVTLRLWSLPALRPYNPEPGRMAEAIAADLAAAGIDVAPVAASPDSFAADTLAADREGAVLLGWVSDNGDPDNLLAPLLGCDAVGISNRANWCSPRFDALLAEARGTIDAETRAGLYAEAERMVATEAPIAPIVYVGQTMAARDTVTGLVVDPFGRHNFEAVGIEPD